MCFRTKTTPSVKQPSPYSGASIAETAVKVEIPRGIVVIEREPAQPAPLPPVRNVQLNLSPSTARALEYLLANSFNYNAAIQRNSVYHQDLMPLIQSMAVTKI